MQVFSEFVMLLLATLGALLYFDPRLRDTWSPSMRYLMIALVALLAASQLLLKGMTGKGIDDRVGNQVAEWVCSIAVVSSRCSSEVIKRAQTETDFMNRKARFAQLIEGNRASKIEPKFRCPPPVRYVMLEQGECKPYPCSIDPDMDNGIEPPGGHYAFTYLNQPPYYVTCTGYTLAEKGRKFRLPEGLEFCSFTAKDFSCW